MGMIPQEVIEHAGSDEQVAMGGTMSATRNTLIMREKTLITLSRHQISLNLSDPSPKISDTKETIAEWTL
jgi:hypothetical protein